MSEERINPDEWTEREMILHTFRKVQEFDHTFKELIEKIDNDHRYSELENRVSAIETRNAENDGKRKASVWLVGTAITVASIVIQMIMS